MSIRLILVVTLAFAYAALRYVGFGDVAAAHLPAFVANKALSLTAVLALVPAALARRRGDGLGARGWEWLAGAAAALHVLLSLGLMSAATYPPLYAEQRLNLAGELVLVSGALAAALAWWMRSERGLSAYLYVPLLLALLVHTVSRGLSGWLAPAGWPGGMPPISLLAALALVASAVLRGRRAA